MRAAAVVCLALATCTPTPQQTPLPLVGRQPPTPETEPSDLPSRADYNACMSACLDLGYSACDSYCHGDIASPFDNRAATGKPIPSDASTADPAIVEALTHDNPPTDAQAEVVRDLVGPVETPSSSGSSSTYNPPGPTCSKGCLCGGACISCSKRCHVGEPARPHRSRRSRRR